MTEVQQMSDCVEKDEDRAESPGPSCLSVKSDQSMEQPVVFSHEPGASETKGQNRRQRAESPGPSCLSVKSDWSMDEPPNVSHEPGASETKHKFAVSVDEHTSCCPLCQDVLKDPVSTSCGHCFCRCCISSYWDQSGPPGDSCCPQCGKTPRTGHGPQTISVQSGSDDDLHPESCSVTQLQQTWDKHHLKNKPTQTQTPMVSFFCGHDAVTSLLTSSARSCRPEPATFHIFITFFLKRPRSSIHVKQKK